MKNIFRYFLISAAVCSMLPAATIIPDGFPDAGNTGPIGAGLAYSELDPATGGNIDEDGTVIENKDVSGQLVIKADNVVIRNCRITSTSTYCIKIDGGSNARIEYCELKGGTSAGISSGNYTIRHCNIYGAHDGMKAGTGATIEYNYIHDQLKEDGTHNDAIQNSGGGSNQIIRFNSILGPFGETNAALQYSTNTGPIDNILIEGNLLSGGNYMIRMQDKGNGYGCPTNIRFINNVIDTGSYTLGPISTGGCGNFEFACNKTLDGSLFTRWNPVCSTGIRTLNRLVSEGVDPGIPGEHYFTIQGRPLPGRGTGICLLSDGRNIMKVMVLR